jgi:hypothetical protein
MLLCTPRAVLPSFVCVCLVLFVLLTCLVVSGFFTGQYVLVRTFSAVFLCVFVLVLVLVIFLPVCVCSCVCFCAVGFPSIFVLVLRHWKPAFILFAVFV